LIVDGNVGAGSGAERKIAVRPATLQDARSIGRVHVRAWQVAYSEIVPDRFLNRLSTANSSARWRSRIARNDTHIFVVEADRQVVGFCSCGAARDEDILASAAAEIYAFYLHPDYWRRGIGRRMMAHSLSLLREDGYTDVYLWALTENRRAIFFYRAMGFIADGAHKVDSTDPTVQLPESRYRRSLVVEPDFG